MSVWVAPTGLGSSHIKLVCQKMTQGLIVIPQTAYLQSLLTTIRNQKTSRKDFIFCSDKIINLLIQESLNYMDYVPQSVMTPTGVAATGMLMNSKLCGVSIVRAGEAMEAGLRHVLPGIKIGKILIQRDESTALPKLFYSKLPPDISKRTVLLLDPMLATGGSAIKAVQVLQDHGVTQEKIIFVNLVAAPEGIDAFLKHFPNIKVLTAAVDKGLDEKKYIVPGLGDFGCRYFGTLEDDLSD